MNHEIKSPQMLNLFKFKSKSKANNFKPQVMYALFQASPETLTSEAILWAASNLPENEDFGMASTRPRLPYNHNTHSLWKAIGMPSEDPTNTHRNILCAIRDVTTDCEEEFPKSAVFETLEKQCGMEGIYYLAMIGFNQLLKDFLSSPEQKIQQIIEELENIKKGLTCK
jgi:hypothetical protein